MPQSLIVGSSQGIPSKRQRSTDGRMPGDETSVEQHGSIEHSTASDVQMPSYLEKTRSEVLSTFQEIEWKQRFRLFHAMQNPESSPYRVDRSEVVVSRNRYSTVQPWDASRIKLRQPIAGSDYVNASPILLRSRGPGADAVETRYIATQGPKQSQISHFWHMVHQELTGNVGVVIMLTQLQEDNKEKCSQYYPMDLKAPIMLIQHEDDPKTHSKVNNDGEDPFLDSASSSGTDISEATRSQKSTATTDLASASEAVDTIKLLSVEFDDSVACEVRKMILTVNNNPKTITHYLFGRWPDFGKPDTEDRKALVELSRRSYKEADGSPRIVHCSAGVGRTGTWIALDFLVREVDENRLLSNVKGPERNTKLEDSAPASLERWGKSGPQKVMTPTLEDGFDKEEHDLIFDTVNTLRDQRMMMVIRDVQFSFLYDVVREAVLEKYRTKPEGATIKEADHTSLLPRRIKQPRISDDFVTSESASEAETEIIEPDVQVWKNRDDEDPYSATSYDHVHNARGL